MNGKQLDNRIYQSFFLIANRFSYLLLRQSNDKDDVTWAASFEVYEDVITASGIENLG